MIRVGPAGWSYADWEGVVYPRKKPAGFHRLAWLARYFDCVEINSSFYRLPRAEHAGRWAELVEDLPDFRFSAKLLQEFTHGDAASGSGGAELSKHFLAGVEPLVRSHRLAAVLVQFPWSFRSSESSWVRLERIRDLFAELPLALELRHRTWFDAASLARLGGLDYSLVHIDLPEASDHPPRVWEPTGPIGYLRIHGRNTRAWFDPGSGRDQRYDYLYGPPEVTELAERTRRIAQGRDDTYVITNNHFSGKAIANGLELRAILEGRPVPAPASWIEAFPRLADSCRPEGQGTLF